MNVITAAKSVLQKEGGGIVQPILLKYCRMFCDLSQAELAECIGVHQSLLSKIESGTIPMQPEIERKLLEVFSELGMDAETILKVKQTINELKQKG